MTGAIVKLDRRQLVRLLPCRTAATSTQESLFSAVSLALWGIHDRHLWLSEAVERSLADPHGALSIRSRHRNSILSRSTSEDQDALAPSSQWKEEWSTNPGPLLLRIYILVRCEERKNTDDTR